MLEVETEPILWPDIVEPFAVRILRGCGAGVSSENKDEWGVSDRIGAILVARGWFCWNFDRRVAARGWSDGEVSGGVV